MELFRSTKNGTKLCFESYLYTKQETLVSGECVWECEKRRSGTCSAKLTLREDILVKRCNEHTHAPTTSKLEALKTYNAVIDKANNSQEATRSILGVSMENIGEAALVHLPTLRSMKRTVQRKRTATQAFHGNPANAQALIIPDALKMTKNNEQFLQFDIMVNNSKILIFGSPAGIKALSKLHRILFITQFVTFTQ